MHLHLLALCLVLHVARATTLPWFPIHNEDIAVPSGVAPWLPTFSPDGNVIFFQNQYDANFWLIDKTSNTPQCITCNFTDLPDKLDGGFTYAFPDLRRLFVSTKELSPIGGSNDVTEFDAYILECQPSLVQCHSHIFVPVDMSGDRKGLHPATRILMRRTWHLAPDGKHISWTDIRTDGSAMLIGRLERESDRYYVNDIKVVNPLGPNGPQSLPVDKSEYAVQLWELKSFIDGGKGFLAVAGINSNIDTYKVDLTTGKTVRLTANPDWDEDGALSPDKSMEVIYSWRTRHRLDTTSAIPQLRNFIGFPLVSNIYVVWISSWPGFQCDLSPWLLPGVGDSLGKLTGQPLRIYANDETAGNNLAGQPFWSPDSTRILLQGRLRQPVPTNYSESVKTKGLVPPRVLVARVEKPPAQERAPVDVEIGSWATPVEQWQGPFANDRSEILPGKASGRVSVTYKGNLLAGNITATFNHYSDDNKTFIDGHTIAHMTVLPSEANKPSIEITIAVTGENHGSMHANIVREVDNSLVGSWSTTYNGKQFSGLPILGPCYNKLPTRTPLRVRWRRQGDHFNLFVDANIAGDLRPVQNAQVQTSSGVIKKTDANGKTTIPLNAGKTTITAGDTFTAVTFRPSIQNIYDAAVENE